MWWQKVGTGIFLWGRGQLSLKVCLAQTESGDVGKGMVELLWKAEKMSAQYFVVSAEQSSPVL